MNHRLSTFFAMALTFGAFSVACEGDSHDLGSEDAAVSTDVGTEGDGGVPSNDVTTQMRCAPIGSESCLNSNEIVRCAGDHYETIATCAESCLLFGQNFTCAGGARPFTPINVGLIVDGAVRASISTVSGAIGCGLVDDYANSPGLSAEQVYLVLANVGFECPDGIYGLNADCDETFPADSSARCAVYRRWSGSRIEAAEALAGAVTISSAQPGVCTYQVDLVLGGQQQTVRFSAETGGSTGPQFCLNPM